MQFHVSLCVCVRERERERERYILYIYMASCMFDDNFAKKMFASNKSLIFYLCIPVKLIIIIMLLTVLVVLC